MVLFNFNRNENSHAKFSCFRQLNYSIRLATSISKLDAQNSRNLPWNSNENVSAIMLRNRKEILSQSIPPNESEVWTRKEKKKHPLQNQNVG